VLGGEPLKLFAPRVIAAGAEPGQQPGQQPGIVREVGPGGLVVACGGGTAVAFAELQFPGKRRMAAGLARDRVAPGTRLGS
jgi:methionyl-tRNA formyltransferase